MNILIVAQHYSVCSARYAADAFTRLGHTVRHVGPAMGRNIWGGQVPEEYVWTPDNDIAIVGDLTFDNSRQMIDSGIEVVKPDIIIVMDSDPAILDRQINAPQGVPLIVWGVDNHVRDYRRPYFDHYFLAHKSVSVMDWAGREDQTWLPCAYDPVAFPPSPIAWADRAYDVCMIGVMYEKRWELVQAMRTAGLKVLAGTGLVYDAYRDAYHNSRVALVSSACGDLPIRLFEGAGMGCAVLCDEIHDLVLMHNSMAEVPLMTYQSVEGAVKTAAQFQGHDGKIWADRAPKWAVNHTFDKRAAVIIDWMATR